MRKKPYVLQFLLCILGMLFLIIDSKTAVRSAAEAIELCIMSVVPALFPLMVLSSLLVSILHAFRIPILEPIGKLCGIPKGAEVFFLVGVLGGYPVGASCISQAWKDGSLPKASAERLLGFCSNAGPPFIFGICGALFADPVVGWALWGTHIISAMISGMILPRNADGYMLVSKRTPISIQETIRRCVGTMAQICGWVVMFRVLTGFLDRWLLWLAPNELRTMLLGCLELTNGCLEMRSISSEGLRFVICNAMLAAGGLCVFMQTSSAVGKLGVGMYIPGKLLHCATSILVSILLQPILFGQCLSAGELALPGLLLGLLLSLFIPMMGIYKKSGSILLHNRL